MWAVIPQLVSQPVVELIPDQPSRVVQYGWPSDFGQVLNHYRVNVFPYIGQPVTLSSTLHGIGAVHCMLRVDQYTDLSLCLGNTYSLRLQSLVHEEPSDGIHPFGAGSFRYLHASIVGSNAGASMPLIPYPSRVMYPNNAGLVVCFGYSYDAFGQLKAYAHISSHRANALAQFQDGIVPSCGSGTASVLASVDPSLAFSGNMSIVVREPDGIEPGDQTGWGGIEFFHMACHFGPFLQSRPHIQDSWSSKSVRAGTRVASLRSLSTNFSQPMATGGPFISNLSGNNQGVADVDCAGHAEFSRCSLFAVSLAGQPDDDVAYVPQNETWRSNCGFSEAQNTRLSAMKLEASGLNVSPVLWHTEEFTFTADSIPSDSYGNNEYAGSIESNVEAYDRIWATVTLAGFEDVEDYAATPISSVVVNARFVVTVNVFAEKDGARATLFGIPWLPIRSSLSRTLNETEAAAFFNGQSISLGDGAVTLTAIGS